MRMLRGTQLNAIDPLGLFQDTTNRYLTKPARPLAQLLARMGVLASADGKFWGHGKSGDTLFN